MVMERLFVAKSRHRSDKTHGEIFQMDSVDVAVWHGVGWCCAGGDF